MTAITTAEHTPANQTASSTAPKYRKSGLGTTYVLTTDPNGISAYEAVGECAPTVAEIEMFVVPMLRELGVEKAMFAGEYVRASKWGAARLSDELLLVVLSDREYADFMGINRAAVKELDVFIEVRLYECDFMAPDGNLDDFAFPRFSDWKVLAL